MVDDRDRAVEIPCFVGDPEVAVDRGIDLDLQDLAVQFGDVGQEGDVVGDLAAFIGVKFLRLPVLLEADPVAVRGNIAGSAERASGADVAAEQVSAGFVPDDHERAAVIHGDVAEFGILHQHERPARSHCDVFDKAACFDGQDAALCDRHAVGIAGYGEFAGDGGIVRGTALGQRDRAGHGGVFDDASDLCIGERTAGDQRIGGGDNGKATVLEPDRTFVRA